MGIIHCYKNEYDKVNDYANYLKNNLSQHPIGFALNARYLANLEKNKVENECKIIEEKCNNLLQLNQISYKDYYLSLILAGSSMYQAGLDGNNYYLLADQVKDLGGKYLIAEIIRQVYNGPKDEDNKKAYTILSNYGKTQDINKLINDLDTQLKIKLDVQIINDLNDPITSPLYIYNYNEIMKLSKQGLSFNQKLPSNIDNEYLIEYNDEPYDKAGGSPAIKKGCKIPPSIKKNSNSINNSNNINVSKKEKTPGPSSPPPQSLKEEKKQILKKKKHQYHNHNQ